MEEKELLQAIRQIVKEEVDPVKQDVTGLKAGQELLQQEVAGLTAGQESLKQAQSMTDINLEKGQKSLQGQITKISVILENDIDRKLTALFDGHKLDQEKIDHIMETVEAINNSYAATDMITRLNTAEINKLKAK